MIRWHACPRSARSCCCPGIECHAPVLRSGRCSPIVQLADFGFSVLCDASGFTPFDGPVGTPAYLSPEVLTAVKAEPYNAQVGGDFAGQDHRTAGVLPGLQEGALLPPRLRMLLSTPRRSLNPSLLPNPPNPFPPPRVARPTMSGPAGWFLPSSSPAHLPSSGPQMRSSTSGRPSLLCCRCAGAVRTQATAALRAHICLVCVGGSNRCQGSSCTGQTVRTVTGPTLRLLPPLRAEGPAGGLCDTREAL